MVKTLFTGNVALNQCNDCKDDTVAPTKVSNLVQKPQMNNKYEDAWFLKQNPQHWNNVRTAGMLRDVAQPSDDPIMRLNPTLYKQVQEAKGEVNFTDPFYKVMEQQHKWLEDNKFVKDMVYRTDLDHPHSMHNKVTSQDIQVKFPSTQNGPAP